MVVNPTSSWFNYTLSHGGVLHGMLCSVAAFANTVYGFKTSVDIVHHRGELLKAIRSSLTKERPSKNDSGASETLIAMVAVIASFEVCSLFSTQLNP